MQNICRLDALSLFLIPSLFLRLWQWLLCWKKHREREGDPGNFPLPWPLWVPAGAEKPETEWVWPQTAFSWKEGCTWLIWRQPGYYFGPLSWPCMPRMGRGLWDVARELPKFSQGSVAPWELLLLLTHLYSTWAWALNHSWIGLSYKTAKALLALLQQPCVEGKLEPNPCNQYGCSPAWVSTF